MRRVTGRLTDLRDTLNQLDAAIGDGDTGISMSKGAVGIQAYLAANPPGENLGKTFADIGRALNKAAPSSLGTLLAMAIVRAGTEAEGKTHLDSNLLVKMLRIADQTVQQLGKSKPGDKTIVDALHPAVEAFADAIDHGLDLKAALTSMVQAARAGRDAVIPLRSKAGRAGWVGERSENHPDPGTVVIVQVFEALLGCEYSEPRSTLQ